MSQVKVVSSSSMASPKIESTLRQRGQHRNISKRQQMPISATKNADIADICKCGYAAARLGSTSKFYRSGKTKTKK
jgi:hypothetical protein